MITPRRARTGYRQIADDLRGQITCGHVGPGESLPSITRLSQEYGVNPVTVRRALAVLEQEGLVDVEATQGTRVRVPQARTRVAVPRGAIVVARRATDREQVELGLPAGAYVQVITLGGRVRSVHPADEVELTIA